MLRHLLKLSWHRKRANALVGLEIFVSFLVLFLVSAIGVSTARNMRAPLGYQYREVLRVGIQREMRHEFATEDELETARQLLRSVKELPEVEAVAISSILPYSSMRMQDGRQVNGRYVMYGCSDVSDGLQDAMQVQLSRGRWFSREDDGAAYQPVVITADLARAFFGDQDPLGHDFPTEDAAPRPGQPAPPPPLRVVGVMDAYRGEGEFSELTPYALMRTTLHGDRVRLPQNLAVRVRPGTPAAFQETLAKTLEATAREWSFTVEPMTELRESTRKARLTPLAVVALVAAFLMLMVGLGLTGVLWQYVTKRTKEFGLRRAAGATSRQVSMQILAEMWIVTTLAVALGAAVVLQLPLLSLVRWITPATFAAGLGVAVASLYTLTAVCSLYPGWLAMRVSPSDALRYE
jgi:putative ABC transport system permease protein